jgi:hypothetical protein
LDYFVGLQIKSYLVHKTAPQGTLEFFIALGKFCSTVELARDASVLL